MSVGGVGRVGRPGSTRAGKSGPVAKTYADFQAHIIATYPTTVAWASEAASVADYRTTAAAATGTMQGSPYLISYRSAATCRVVQHGLPSFAVFSEQVAGGKQVVIRQIASADTSAPAVDRNSFLSSDVAGGGGYWKCDRVIYFDDALGPMQVNPSTGTGPTPYVIP